MRMFTVRPFRGSVSDAYGCLAVEGARKRLYEVGKCKRLQIEIFNFTKQKDVEVK